MIPSQCLQFFLFILSLSVALGTHSAEDCHRDMSRKARAQLTPLLEAVQEADYSLPAKCPLRKSNDMLLPHERAKKENKRSEWQCLYCNKLFKGEYYLDKHLSRKHMDKLSEKSTFCPADICGIVDCGERENVFQEVQSCDEEEMEQYRLQCYGLLHKCFPVEDGDPAKSLHKQFKTDMCDNLTCENLNKPKHVKATLWDRLWFFFQVSAVVTLVVYYVIVFWNRRELTQQGDLHHASLTRRLQRLARSHEVDKTNKRR